MLAFIWLLGCQEPSGPKKRTTKPNSPAVLEDQERASAQGELGSDNTQTTDATSSEESHDRRQSSSEHKSSDPVLNAHASCGSGGIEGQIKKVTFEDSLYYITTPKGYRGDKAWPLIIGLHGDEGDPAKSVNVSWRNVANDSFIFVAPKASNKGGSWYQAIDQNSQWMDKLMDSLLQSYNIDLDRIYIWGLSGGAMFISGYAMDRQDRFAAVQFNMGGSPWPWKRGKKKDRTECLAPTRFVVADDDFLYESAFELHQLLAEKNHESTWIDADCSGHCWDKIEAGAGARDWFLDQTRCGETRPPGCYQPSKK